jgi:hypothetical protein
MTTGTGVVIRVLRRGLRGLSLVTTVALGALLLLMLWTVMVELRCVL